MYCQTCNQFLGAGLSGFIVCPKCGHVNVAASNSQVQPQQPATFFGGVNNMAAVSSTDNRKLSLRLKFVYAAILAIAVGAVLVMGVEKNLSAQKQLNQAVSLDRNGKYSDAAKVLKAYSSSFVLPATNQKIHSEVKTNQKWVEYHSYQISAEQLIKSQKYPEALVLLQKIPKEYPTYSYVAKDIEEIKKQQAIIAQQQAMAAQQAEAAKKAAEAAKNSVPKSVRPPARPSAPAVIIGCFPPSSISGKRLVNTSAFSSVLNATSVSQVQEIMRSFFSQYGVSVEITAVAQSSYAKQYSSYKLASAGDLCSLKAFSAILIDEWAKYPTDWVKNSRVKDIVIVKNLVVVGQNRAAMPDPGGSDMYYDLTYSGDYARETIHHEYDHLIEYNYFGSFSHSDPTWQSYNPAGFTYGNGGSACYVTLGSCSNAEHPLHGFVTSYSITAIEEDKAELYAYLMTNTYYHHMKSWLPSDPNLSNKVNNYKNFIASHSTGMAGAYYDQINP
jgi:hypothetical protein